MIWEQEHAMRTEKERLRAEVARLTEAHVESQRNGAREAIARRDAEAEVTRLKAQLATVAAHVKCAMCGKPATCIGTYEHPDNEEQPSSSEAKLRALNESQAQTIDLLRANGCSEACTDGQAEVARLRAALEGLLTTSPGNSDERNRAIAAAEDALSGTPSPDSRDETPRQSHSVRLARINGEVRSIDLGPALPGEDEPTPD
jgi:hypothetical protein